MWFEVHTLFRSCCFCPLKFFVDAKEFGRGTVLFIRHFFSVFFMSNVFPHKKECIPTFTTSWEMLNRVVVGLFRSKMEVKSSKSVCRGIFYSWYLILFFYDWMMRRYSKNIPAKFQNCPTFLAWFFPNEWRWTTLQLQGGLSSSLHVVSTRP